MRARVSLPSSADGMYQFVGLGYCALTSSIPSSCRDDDKGSWPLPPLASSTNAAAELACSTMCAQCANCHYISYSLRAQECSWFASCGRLKTDVNGFSTIRVVKGGQSRSAFVAVSSPSPAPSKRAAADHEAFGSFLGKVSAGAPGYCEATEFHGEYWHDRACECTQNGAWLLPLEELRQLPDDGRLREWASAWCLRQCETCANCRFVSVSVNDGDCSWFSTCPGLHADRQWLKGNASTDFVTHRLQVRASERGTSRPPALPACRDYGAALARPPQGRLDAEALNRSLTYAGTSSAWHGLFSRLEAGRPVTVGVLGASVAQNGGCLSQPGKRCMAYAGRQPGQKLGWAVGLFDWLNQSWPHPEHVLANGATDATAMQHTAPCLFSHIPPSVNLAILEFGSMAPLLEVDAIEIIVRALLALPSKPAVVLLSVRKWHAAATTLASRNFVPWPLDEDNSWLVVEESTMRVCRHYGIACLSVHRMLLPLVLGRRPGFRLADVVGTDGLHPINSNHGWKYITQALEHLLASSHAEWRQGWRPMAAQAAAPMSSAAGASLPPALLTKAAKQSAASCFAFNPTGKAHGSGHANVGDFGRELDQMYAPLRWRSAWCRDEPPQASALPEPCTAPLVQSCPDVREDAAYERFMLTPPRVWVYCGVSLSPKSRKLSPGVVAVVPGAVLRTWIPVSQFKMQQCTERHTHGSLANRSTELGDGAIVARIRYLKSYAGGMGTVRLTCFGRCRCVPTVIDAHYRGSHGHTLSVFVETNVSIRQACGSIRQHGHAQQQACGIQLFVLNTTSSGGHKFKARSIVVTHVQ